MVQIPVVKLEKKVVKVIPQEEVKEPTKDLKPKDKNY
jgi:hypothetical protein